MSRMSDEELDRNLQMVGKMCFIKHLEIFRDDSITPTNAVDRLMKAEKYKESGCIMRVGGARKIIRCGRLKDALAIISRSGKVDPEWRHRAQSLLSSL